MDERWDEAPIEEPWWLPDWLAEVEHRDRVPLTEERPAMHQTEYLASIGSSVAELLRTDVEDRERASRADAAGRYRAVDQLRRFFESEHGASWRDPDDLAWRDLRAEVAAALHIHERAAQSLLDIARTLVERFPTTLAQLSDGLISDRNARILADQGACLPERLHAEFETRLLPDAAVLVPSRFERAARLLAASLDPEQLIVRHQEALPRRRVALEPCPDGMAWYGAYLPAEEAVGAAAVVTGIAKRLHGVDGEERTLAQVEADVFRDLLTDAAGTTPPATSGSAPVPSPASKRGVTAEVLATVPVFTAMDLADTPGVLDGYGPIDADTARKLVGTGSGFYRVLTDPADGATLSFGRTRYRVPAELRRLLRARDEVCRFVGCTRSAAHCDIDHAVPWSEDGETVIENLAHLCRGHHRLKERGRWRIGHAPPGDLTWTSPTGATYHSPPARPAPPPPGAAPLVMTSWLRSAPADDTAPF